MIKYALLTVFCITTACDTTLAQKKYKPTVITCGCDFRADSNFIKTAPANLKEAFSQPFAKIDSSFKTQCGYLIVPENRNKQTSKMIKLPFIIVKSKNPSAKKDPVLFTSGGPGNSSLSWALGATKGELIKDRDCIAFEQRGTRYAIPHLRTFDLDVAIKEAYRKNLNKDSMVLEGVKHYRKTLEAKGIDLAGYNSDETASDIQDLLTTLKIDSVNLMGGSYSGGLILAVLQKDPTHIRSLVLDSPLPMFSPIDEDEPANFNEALDVYFNHVEKDSVNKALYSDLGEKFRAYFNSITGKTFHQHYLEAGTKDTINIAYDKNDLLSVVIGTLSDNDNRKNLAYTINEIIKGNHKPYITPLLNDLFRKNQAPDGMRMSVYCADQASYHSQEIVKQLYTLYPYMAGYHINDVYKTMCDCWKVPPVKPATKQPFYSNKPIFLADGEMDPGCRPLYMDMIHHYMPNSRRFLLINKGHGVIFGKEMNGYVREFLNAPFKKITSTNNEIIVY